MAGDCWKETEPDSWQEGTKVKVETGVKEKQGE